MDNLFLIHNDNSFTEIEHITDDLKFGLDDPANTNTVIDSNIDNYISNIFIPSIQDKEIDILFIKDSLSKNYLDFLGLRLAYHIRLSEELGDKRFIPIVILSDLDGYNLNKFTSLARVLFTKNIFIGENTPHTIEFYKDNLIINEDLKNNFRENFLDMIEVEAPKDYLSSHSIANEWSIYRWGKYLDIPNEDIENNISSMLYFKYLMNNYPIEEADVFTPEPPAQTGKVLYIDDELRKGWKEIFEHLFSIDTITFECLDEEYKYKEAHEIIEFVKAKILEYDPDTVILDLRLHYDDFKEGVTTDNLTGVKVLKFIKEEINRGIQCVALTASQDSLILEKLYEYDIVGYVKKEHPNNYKIDTKENINKVVSLVDKGLENKYLKDIWTIQEEIKALQGFTITDEADLVSELFTNSQFVFDILNGKAENKMSMAVLTIYKCFEVIVKIYINNNKFKDEIDLTSHDILVPPSTPSISGTLWHLFNIFQIKLSINDAPQLYSDTRTLHLCRKDIVHADATNCTFTSEDIVQWFNILKIVVTEIKNNHD